MSATGIGCTSHMATSACSLCLQAYPKVLDMFLLVLYGSLIAVAYTQTAWLLRWANVLHHGAVACFMWVSANYKCDHLLLEGPLRELLSCHHALVQTGHSVKPCLSLLEVATAIKERQDAAAMRLTSRDSASPSATPQLIAASPSRCTQ